MSIGSQIIILFILVLLSAFFSSTETAITSLSRVRIRLLSSKYDNKSSSLTLLADQPNQLITTILILNNLVNIGASSMATLLFLQVLPDAMASYYKGIITTVTMTIMLLAFGEITPKNFAKNNTERYTLATINVIYLLSLALKPVVKAFHLISDGILSTFSSELIHREPTRVSEEELKALIDVAQERDLLDKHEGDMIKRIFSYDDLMASDVMVPRTETHTIEAANKISEAKELIAKYGHSRYPVRDGQVDEIIGTLYSKDLLRHSEDSDLEVREIIRPAYFIPSTKPINALLREFQGEKIHLAIALDEYGGIAGIITLEDILEEIVGEIEDEFDTHEVMMEEVKPGELIVNGECEVKQLNRSIGLGLPEVNVTIGGLIIDHLERIPPAGTSLTVNDVEMTVEQSSKRRVKKVRIVFSPGDPGKKRESAGTGEDLPS
ncbi:MAG: hemolysin family protein [Candidatus Acetothermia bacterium]